MTSRRQELYAQCYMQRVAPDGSIHHTVGFIPAKFAVPGKKLVLTLGRQGPTSGWEVMSAGTQLFEENLLRDQSRDYKKMRKASDI